MNFLISILFALTISVSNPPDIHEFHLSKSMMKYNQDEKAIQISLHLFIDDFEEALANKGADSMNLFKNMEHARADEYIELYLKDRLQIMVDDQKLEFHYLGKEMSEDLAGVWMYLEIANVEIPKSIEVENRLLIEMFEDQRNIMNVNANGKADYLMFTNEDIKQTLTWE